MRLGAERMCMPSPTVEQFVEAVKATVLANKRWVTNNLDMKQEFGQQLALSRLMSKLLISHFRFPPVVKGPCTSGHCSWGVELFLVLHLLLSTPFLFMSHLWETILRFIIFDTNFLVMHKPNQISLSFGPAIGIHQLYNFFLRFFSIIIYTHMHTHLCIII